jgi:hypothetical protein
MFLRYFLKQQDTVADADSLVVVEGGRIVEKVLYGDVRFPLVLGELREVGENPVLLIDFNDYS